MPTIYLSPSIQPYNKYLTEGDEQYWMNRIADDMVPMLEQNDINVVRNTPNTSLGQAIRESNAGNYDLHLALHSNAGPSNLAGKLRGPDVYYYPYSASGKRAAELIADENLPRPRPCEHSGDDTSCGDHENERTGGPRRDRVPRQRRGRSVD